MAELPRSPVVAVSWGEVLDKITILEIKAERLGDRTALANVANELRCLNEVAQVALGGPRVRSLVAELKVTNEALWDVEDALRERETASDFGDQFVELARAVYRTNDRRAALKRELNTVLGSEFVEEKSYGGRDQRARSPESRGGRAARAPR